MPPRTIVLASTSRYRRALLDPLGVSYVAASPHFVEDHALRLSPSSMVEAFARGKAESLAEDHPNALIIGSDQIPELDGRVLTKPATHDAAVDQLLALAGRTHVLRTAVAVHDSARALTSCRRVDHRMTMRPLTRALAEAYVARDQPLDCAGSYRIESLGVLLFESMEGSDHTAIIGMPLSVTAALLREHGVDLLVEATRCRP